MVRNCMMKFLQWWKLCIAKTGLPCTELLNSNDGVKSENDKIMF